MDSDEAHVGDISGYRVQRVRAVTGLLVVIAGDLAIALAAMVALSKLTTDSSQVVAVLTAAFTAVSTMTTAHFGIRAVTSTAQSAVTAANAAGSG